MKVVKISETTPFITKDGAEIREILAPSNSFMKNQSLAEARILPGDTTKQHQHIKSEEIYYILYGNAEMTVVAHPLTRMKI